MKNRRFTLAIVMVCLLMCLGLFARPAHAADGKCGDNLYWSFNESSGQLTITGSGMMENYSIFGAPWSGKTVKSVSFPEGLTSIGDCAFMYCSELTSAPIPNSVVQIGKMAFEGCALSGSLIIPDSVTSIGEYAFEQNKDLTDVTIGKNVARIGKFAFKGCTGLTSVVIPDSVASLDQFAFAFCDNLTTVTFPCSARQMSTFLGCDKIITIHITKGSGSWQISDRMTDAKYVILDEGITEIGANVFMGSNIASIVIPDSVTRIGADAFKLCSELTAVDLGNGVTEIGDKAFMGCSNLTSIHLPAGVSTVGQWAFFTQGLSRVYYGGTEAARNGIRIASGNDSLIKAAWTYQAGHPRIAYDAAAGTYGFVSGGASQKNDGVWGVIGTICGTGWDTDFPMTEIVPLIYRSEPLTLKRGEEYKVRQNGSWEVNFGGNGQQNGPNLVVGADGKYCVWFNSATGDIWLEKN